MKKYNKIAFWIKPSKNLLSHGKGLTQDDIKFLQSLKVGDRLIIWDNSERNENSAYPTHSLTIYEDNRQTIKRKEKSNGKVNKGKSILA